MMADLTSGKIPAPVGPVRPAKKAGGRKKAVSEQRPSKKKKPELPDNNDNPPHIDEYA